MPDKYEVTISFTRRPQQAQALLAVDALIAAPIGVSINDPEIAFLAAEWPSMFAWWIEELIEKVGEEMPDCWKEEDRKFLSALVTANRAYYGALPTAPWV